MYVATHSNLARREETRKVAAAQAEVHKASRVREMQEQMKLAAAAQKEKEQKERARRRQMAEDIEQEVAVCSCQLGRQGVRGHPAFISGG
jgi:hypothetical protein